MTTVRKLADEISVICTIHQPSSTVLALFDDLLLLEPGGRVAYHGCVAKSLILQIFSGISFDRSLYFLGNFLVFFLSPMAELPQYLTANGFGEAPAGENVTNFFLKLLADRAQANDTNSKNELGRYVESF
jgi:hypothetical protein